MPVTKTKFQKRHWKHAGEFILQEYERRKGAAARIDKERIWKEIDRQVQMRAKPSKKEGEKDSWLPDTELPLQATALEVLQSDAQRLTFPRGAEWYFVHSEVTDSFEQKFQERRETVPIIGEAAIPMKMDQETADILVKSTIDFFHKKFNFRASADFLDIEALKYGTYAGRVIETSLPILSGDFRGKKIRGPAMVPVSIKNLYLDDSPQAVMFEGLSIAPSNIREFWQRRDDLIRAAKIGGPSRGWLPTASKIELKDPSIPVHMLEFEGDLVIPKTKNHFFLPNVLVTVAVGDNGPTVVRFRENTTGFRSYFSGVYEKEDMDSPYGTSPLMKGQPIQELATMMANSLAAAVALAAQPPALWDSADTKLTAAGGPDLSPGALTESDDPLGSVNVMQDWNIADISGALAISLQQYEGLTGVTAPRRGAQTKSHTTAFAVDVENTRGLVRTDDYVQAKEKGPLTSILEKEYAIIKKKLPPTSIFVGTGGIEGFITIDKDDLPDNVVFEVVGSAGPATERERMAGRMEAIQQAAAISQLSMQQGGPTLNFAEAMKETLKDAFPNPDRFITSPQGVPNAAPAVGGVPGPAGVVPEQ